VGPNPRELLESPINVLPLDGCESYSETSDMEQVTLTLLRSPTKSPTIPSTTPSSLTQFKDFGFGTVIDSGRAHVTDYLSNGATKCDTLGAENDHELYSIFSIPGPYHFTRGDKIVARAKTNGMDTRYQFLLCNRAAAARSESHSLTFGF